MRQNVTRKQYDTFSKFSVNSNSNCLLLSAVQKKFIYSFIYFLPGKDGTHKNDLAPNVWLHSSVGRASHRHSRRSPVRNPLKPWIFFRLLFLNCINWWAHGEDRAIACFSLPYKIISFILSSNSFAKYLLTKHCAGTSGQMKNRDQQNSTAHSKNLCHWNIQPVSCFVFKRKLKQSTHHPVKCLNNNSYTINHCMQVIVWKRGSHMTTHFLKCQAVLLSNLSCHGFQVLGTGVNFRWFQPIRVELIGVLWFPHVFNRMAICDEYLR